MTLPRRARLAVVVVVALLLGGLLGLVLWGWWRHRHPAPSPPSRARRVYVVLAATGIVVIAAGSLWRLAVATEPVHACTPPGGTQAASGRTPLDASLVAEKVATWPETGVGMLYASTEGARICRSRAADYYVALHPRKFRPSLATNVGDLVISPGFKELDRAHLRALAQHEAAHRAQWAVGTVLGGPLAYPIAYAVDDFFFPGPRNHFERLAGLEAGGYSHVSDWPVLGPAQLLVLGLVAVGIPAALVLRRTRWRRRRPRD
jgi:hypothetical protein